MSSSSKAMNHALQLARAKTYFEKKQYADVCEVCKEILFSMPQHPEANYLIAISLFKMNVLHEAFKHLQNALLSDSAEPKYLNAYIEGLVQTYQGQQIDLLISAAQFLTVTAPRQGQSWHMLGVGLAQAKKPLEASVALQRATKLLPENPFILSSLGNALSEIGHKEEAVAAYDKAILLKPDFAMAYSNRGNALKDLLLRSEAFDSYQKALQLKPDYAEVYSNMGVLHKQLGEFGEAISAFEKSIELNPGLIPAHNNLASVLRSVGRLEESLKRCEFVLSKQSNYPEYWSNYGYSLADSFRLDDAIECFIRALSIYPDDTGDNSRQTLCSLFFILNYHPDLSAEAIYDVYCDYERKFGAPYRSFWSRFNNDKQTQRKLKIGYVSAAFAMHPCKFFLEPLMAHHDHNAFEIYGYAEIDKVDEFTERYQGYCDHWLVTTGMPDQQLANQIRSDQIDILVDISGHTGGNRLSVFARKPAPVSLHWLDFGYTTGLKAVDYYLTDNQTIPVGTEHVFSEQPWRLPGSALVYRPGPAMGDVSDLPANKNAFITFGTLTRSIRINYRVIRAWVAILNAVPNSMLMIDSGNFRGVEVQEAMAARFTSLGIERERLLIGCHSPPWDTMRQIDIGLDCFPHNSGTTLCETLYMGLPFITLAGRPSVGRLGASILSAAGYPQWIAFSEDEYVAKAIELASDIPKLSDYRRNLRQNMQASSLMDEPRFAKEVEQAYFQMWQRYCTQEEQI